MSLPLLRNSWNWLFPVVAGILYLLIILTVMQTGAVKYHQLTRTLSQWDGQHYLTIARDGYKIEPCPPGFPDDYLCGNIGWFPGYPLIVSLITWLPVAVPWALLIINWIAFIAGLGILYRILVKKYDIPTARVSIVALLCFPTSFYFIAAFPYALYFLCSVLIFFLLKKKVYGWIIPLIALLTITYPSGLMIALPLLYYLMTNRKTISPTKRIQLLTGVIITGVSLACFAGYYWLKFDNFFLYQDFQAQALYDHQISFPLTILAKSFAVNPAQVVSDLQSALQASYSTYLIQYRYATVWLITILLLIIFLIFYTKKIPVIWQIYMWGILLFTPTFGTLDCYYRHIIVAWPIFVMVGAGMSNRWRRYAIPVILLFFLWLTFFIYIPLFKIGQLM